MQFRGTEVFFDKNDLIVSKTDLKGRLTYINHTFMDIAGYEEVELLGQPHNVIRNPSMPRTIFEYLWKTIADGKELFAYVVNETKPQDHYWVIAHVTPSWEGGHISGYHSTRRVPNPQTIKNIIIPLYDNLKAIEDRNPSRKDGIADGMAALTAVLNEKNVSYNEFIADLMKDD